MKASEKLNKISNKSNWKEKVNYYKMKDLINWKELSRILAGNDDSIRRNKIPKKYAVKVNSLLTYIDKWNKKNNETFAFGSNEYECPICMQTKRTDIVTPCKCDL